MALRRCSCSKAILISGLTCPVRECVPSSHMSLSWVAYSCRLNQNLPMICGLSALNVSERHWCLSKPMRSASAGAVALSEFGKYQPVTGTLNGLKLLCWSLLAPKNTGLSLFRDISLTTCVLSSLTSAGWLCCGGAVNGTATVGSPGGGCSCM